MPARSLLITGATGFVGSHVARAIAGAAPDIRALVRTASPREILEEHGIQPVPGSLEDPESLRRAIAGTDVVVHMAAATRAATPAEFERVNATGTRNLVEAVRNSRQRPRRIVYLSSLAAVGPARNGRPVTAEDEPAPLTAYGRTKLEGERIVGSARDVCEVVILRASAVYGPRDRDLYEFFRLAQWGVLPVPSGPVRRLQLVHAADLARAVTLAATADAANGVYHIADERSYAWEEMTRLVARAVGRNARNVRVPGTLIAWAGAVSGALGNVLRKPAIFDRDKARELLAPGWLCETDSAERDLGFRTSIPLEQGLLETANWYRARGWL